jgi:hypothetical protein
MTAVGTNLAAEATGFTDQFMKHIASCVGGYTDLSTDEKSELISFVKSLSGQIDSNEISKLASLVRPDEGKLLQRILQRYHTIVAPVTSASKGIYVPLDSVIDSTDKLNIYLPENLESYVDYGLIIDLMRYIAHVPNVQLHRVSGVLDIPNEDKVNFFFMGYISELISNQRIEKISYNRDSAYQQGRHCARTKTLLMVIDHKQCPSKYLKIPQRYLGGTMQFKEPEITRILRTIVKGTILERVETLLHNLAKHCVKQCLVEVRNKIGENLFIPSSEFVHSLKRRVTRTAIGPKKRQIVVSETIDPTKPSQIATAAPWERDSFQEIYEDPWKEEEKLIQEFNKIPGLGRNYPRFAQRLAQIFDEQWSSKQRILRRTRHRLEGYPGDRGDPLWKKLNWIRQTLIEFNTLDRVPTNIRQEFNPYGTIGPEKIPQPDGLAATIAALHKNDNLASIYPAAEVLLQQWDTLMSQASGETPDG